MQIEAVNVQVGDKGYSGDTEGAYVVKTLRPRAIWLVHETTGERLRISIPESFEQDWAWFRD